MFRLCFSVVLVYIFGTNLAKHTQKEVSDNKDESDSIFASVIENITRVNYELQELINNYKQLQQLYKSQENLDSESTDGEIDESYKNRQNRDGDEKTTKTLTTQRDEKYPATQIIWSEDENDEDNDASDSDNATDSTEDIKPENPELELIEIDKHPNHEPIEIDKQTDIIFVDTRIAQTKKTTLGAIKFDTPSKKSPKTRYSKVSQSKSILRLKHDSKKKQDKENDSSESPIKNNATTNNDTSETELTTIPTSTADYYNTSTAESIKNGEKNVIVEKKLFSETFSPTNIWDEIINNKPIRLEAHEEVNYRKLRKKHYKDMDLIEKPILRTRDDDPAPNITDSNQINLKYAGKIEVETDKVKEPVLNDSDTNDEGKEEFQANVLREAYGDACLKVVIKKCYKACKAANKAICNKFKCKTEYKEKFDSNTRTGCLKEFNAKRTEDDENEEGSWSKDGDEIFPSRAYAKSNKKVVNASSNFEDLTFVETFEDITRNGYLRACLPHLQRGYRRTVTVAPKKKIPEPKIKHKTETLNFNILRDKYERACEKISYNKCNKACEYAYKKTCESYICDSSRKRDYKKQCKNHCKTEYRKGKSSSDSSYSSDSDSSDTDSSDSTSSSYSSDSDTS